MSERLKEIALKELEVLSASIAVYWGAVVSIFPLATKGTAPDLTGVEKAAKLTDRYTLARRAYDGGQYLACIEIATAEVKV